MNNKFNHTFEELVSIENLLKAWNEFVKGKRAKRDVQTFSLYLMDHILLLHKNLLDQTYRHGGYYAFNICDPKPRNIHKAQVRDRLLHHAVHRVLYSYFDKSFIAHSYSCQINKGTHRALRQFRRFAYKVSKNDTQTCWVLKCDIRKFFANIDHRILLKILAKHIHDKNILWLLENVIKSFSTKPSVGLPLGNLTSQLFVNVYMNEFDQFVKHQLKAKYYIRYADDFVILSENEKHLQTIITPIQKFLLNELKLELHPHKVSIETFGSGVDFLGWVHFFHHRVLRTTSKKRMLKKIKSNPQEKVLNSYLGLLRHGDTHGLKIKVKNEFLLNLDE